MKCADCNNDLTLGICPECHAELYAVEFKNEKMDTPLDLGFFEKLLRQIEETRIQRRQAHNQRPEGQEKENNHV